MPGHQLQSAGRQPQSLVKPARASAPTGPTTRLRPQFGFQGGEDDAGEFHAGGGAAPVSVRAACAVVKSGKSERRRQAVVDLGRIADCYRGPSPPALATFPFMSLDHLRTEIDRIDREQFSCSPNASASPPPSARAKPRRRARHLRADREEALLRNLESIASAGTESRRGARHFPRNHLRVRRACNWARPVAFLGPEGTFMNQAALKNFLATAWR